MKLRLRVLLARPGAVGARRLLVVPARSSCHRRTLYFVCASFLFSSLFRWCFVHFVGPPTRSSSCRQRAVYFVRIDLFDLASLSLFVLHVRRQRFCLRVISALVRVKLFGCCRRSCALCVPPASRLGLHFALLPISVFALPRQLLFLSSTLEFARLCHCLGFDLSRQLGPASLSESWLWAL